jgi:predicted enzyme related to lactoylglutathione lyase
MRRAIAAALFAAACATTSSDLPRINPNPSNKVTAGRPVWHDLVTTDLEKAKAFYGGLFGWSFKDYQVKAGKYALASLGGKPVGGILQPENREVNISQWVTYFSVEDVDAAVAAGEHAGAKLVVPPRDVAHQGRAALLLDPQGAPVAVARMSGGDPPVERAPLNSWLWVDLWTPDPAASTSFYRSFLGLEPDIVDLGGAAYTVLGRDKRPYAGMIRIPQPDIRPNWLPIVRVADAQAAALKAQELGGRVILAPRADVREGQAAIVADPTGGAVALHVWEADQQLRKPSARLETRP